MRTLPTDSKARLVAVAPSLGAGTSGNVGIGTINNETGYVVLISESTAFTKGTDGSGGYTQLCMTATL